MTLDQTTAKAIDTAITDVLEDLRSTNDWTPSAWARATDRAAAAALTAAAAVNPDFLSAEQVAAVRKRASDSVGVERAAILDATNKALAAEEEATRETEAQALTRRQDDVRRSMRELL